MTRLVDAATVTPALSWPRWSVKQALTNAADLSRFPLVSFGCPLASHSASLRRRKGEVFLCIFIGAGKRLHLKKGGRIR